MNPLYRPAAISAVSLALAALPAGIFGAQDQTSTVPSPSPTWKLPPIDYFVQKLPPPPREGSFRDRMDLGDAIARQNAVGDRDLASIQRTYLFNVFYFSDVLGPDFTPKNYPKTAAFFAKLIATSGSVVGGLKDHYKRLRPFQGHPDKIRLLVKNEPGYSYPSGHTTRSRLSAFVLAELAPPAYRQSILLASQDVAVDRILAGEHYLTDLEGGRTLGKMLFWLLSKDPQFQTDLQAVRAAEWAPPPTPLAPVK